MDKIDWINLDTYGASISISSFSGSEDPHERFTVIQFDDYPDSSMSKSLHDLGFLRVGLNFIRNTSSFSLLEMKKAFSLLRVEKMEISNTRKLFSGVCPVKFHDKDSSLHVDSYRRLNDFQVAYEPASALGKPIAAIPLNLAKGTSSALQSLIERKGSIDEWLTKELGYSSKEEMASFLSPEQIDAVALAIDCAHDGTGSICADQTGLGKGRVGAALARWAVLHDRRFIFITEKANLFTDFWRDVVDTGSDKVIGEPFILNDGAKIVDPVTAEIIYKSPKSSEIKDIIASGNLPEKYKVVFLTYSQLNRKGSAKTDFFTNICQGAHIHADESHNAAGAESQTSQSVALGMSGAASYSYSSATHARNASNLAIYSPILPPSITKVENMVEVLSAGGPPLLEALSQMLAETGRLVRREHDLTDMKIELLIDKLRSDEHNYLADKLAPILSSVARLSMDIDSEIDNMNSFAEGHKKTGKYYTIHWGARLAAIVNQFLSTIKIDDCVEKCTSYLMAGEKPVVVLVNTMESLLRDLSGDDNANFEDAFGELCMDEDGTYHEPSFRDALRLLVNRTITINYREGKNDPQKVEIENEILRMEADRILAMIEDFPDLPLSPIDEIMSRVEKNGQALYEEGKIEYPWKMGEISARKMRILEGRAETMKEIDRNEVIAGFQGGSIDGLVLTKAASTGLSLHANARSKDTRPRVMIEHQIPSNVVERVQFWGRIKRRGGINEPRFVCLATNLPYELRPLAIQNRKVAELSANVTGSASTAVSMDVPDPINSLGNRIARRIFEENKKTAYKMGVSLKVDQEKADDELYFVNRFLSRLPLLSSNERDVLYTTFIENYTEALRDLEARGKHPSKPRELDGIWKVVDRTLYEPGNPSDGPVFGRPVYVSTIKSNQYLTPLNEQHVLRLVKIGRRELSEKYGNQVPSQAFKTIIEDVKERRGDLLKAALPSKYSSVVEALQASENNMVKREADKIKKILSFLSAAEIGGYITISDEDNQPKDAVLLGIIPPKDSSDYHKTGHYMVSYLIPGDESPREVSLATLFVDEKFAYKPIHQSRKNNLSYPEFKNLPSGSVEVTRKILDGNPFFAVKLAVEKSMGTNTRITLDSGEIISAVLIPKNKQHILEHLPGSTVVANTALEIVRLGGEVYTNPSAQHEGLVAKRDGPGISIKIPGKKKLSKPFDIEEVTAITGAFKGDWRGQEVFVSPEQFLKVADILFSKGMMLHFSGHWRAVALDATNSHEQTITP